MALQGSNVQQGQQISLDIGADCDSLTGGRITSSNLLITDLDGNSATFTFAATDLGLGTHQLVVDCGSTLIETDLLVYRQNGAERGGANSVVVASSIGLGSAAALLGVPVLWTPTTVRRRDGRQTRHPPQR